MLLALGRQYRGKCDQCRLILDSVDMGRQDQRGGKSIPEVGREPGCSKFVGLEEKGPLRFPSAGRWGSTEGFGDRRHW